MIFKIPEKKGFTLIELLVVISIIGLLSSIVFASLTGARQNAKNAQTIQQYQQYEKAIWLYYDENNGTFPPPSRKGLCMSDSADDKCGPTNGWPEDPLLSAALEKYMGSRPTTDTLAYSTSVWEGYSYVNVDVLVQINYMLYGTSASCAGGYSGKSVTAGNTKCFHNLWRDK